MSSRTLQIRRISCKLAQNNRYNNAKQRSTILLFSRPRSGCFLIRQDSFVRRPRWFSNHEAFSSSLLTEEATSEVEKVADDNDKDDLGEVVVEDMDKKNDGDENNTMGEKIEDEEKDEIMREIYEITYETIHDILAIDPQLQNQWTKRMERMEVARRIPKKNVQEKEEEATFNESTFQEPAGSSLMDLLDDTTDLTTGKPNEDFVKEDISLMDLLNDFDDEEIVPSASQLDLFDDKKDSGNVNLPPLHLDGELTKDPTQQLLDDDDPLSSTDFGHLQPFEVADPGTNGTVNLSDNDDNIDDFYKNDKLSNPLPDGVETDEINSHPPIVFDDDEVNEIGELSKLLDNEPGKETELDYSSQFHVTSSEPIHEYTDCTYQNIMSHGLAMITSLNDKQWREIYDDEDEDKSVFDENEAKLDDSTSNSDNNFLVDHNILPESSESKSDKVLSKMELLLKNAFAGNISLSTEEYNVILMKLASTLVYQSDDTISMMLETYEHMMENREDCSPDGNTYAIIIPALTRKGDVPLEAVKVILDMMRDDFKWDNSEALIQALYCLERSKKVFQAEQLIRKVMASTGERITIPVQAVIPLLRLYKSERMMDEAMDMVDDYIDEAGYGVFLNDVFRTMISWPRFGKTKGRDDIKVFHAFLFNRMQRFERGGPNNLKGVRPFNKTWRYFILQLKKCTPRRGESTETQLIHEILWLLFNRDNRYYPDERLLKCGLEIAERQKDSNLSIEILRRRLTKPQECFEDSTLHEQEKEIERAILAPFPPQALVLAMQTCILSNDAAGIKKLLPIAEHPDLNLPDLVKRKFINQAIRGFVETKNYHEGRKALYLMADRKLTPSDEALGAVIHGLATNGKEEEALQLFEEIKAGVFGDVQPGISCYNGKILSLLQLKSWPEVISLPKEMKELKVTPNSVTFQGFLLASMRMGDESTIATAIRQGIETEVNLDAACFEQSVKCLLPDLLVSEYPSVPEIRLLLREQVDVERDTSIGKAYLSLSRSLRVAEMEDERQQSRNVPEHEIIKRRRNAWATAHADLLKLYALKEKEGNY